MFAPNCEGVQAERDVPEEVEGDVHGCVVVKQLSCGARCSVSQVRCNTSERGQDEKRVRIVAWIQ